MSLSELLADERQVVCAVLDAALSSGLLVSVYDGEEWALDRSNDRAAIECLIGATDETMLRFRSGAPFPDADHARVVGHVWLIHGNGCDVLADHSDGAEMARLLAPALALADRLSTVMQ